MIDYLVQVAEEHEKLAGWAQFAGSMIALLVTAWLAGSEARDQRPVRADTMKSFLVVILLIRRGVEDVHQLLSPPIDTLALNVSTRIRRDNLMLFEPTIDQMGAALTSSFMMNNYSAVRAYFPALRDIYSQILQGDCAGMDERLAMQLLGLDAIAHNLSREVQRLGGRFDAHDDLQLATYLPHTLSARIKLWRRARRLGTDEH